MTDQVISNGLTLDSKIIFQIDLSDLTPISVYLEKDKFLVVTDNGIADSTSSVNQAIESAKGIAKRSKKWNGSCWYPLGIKFLTSLGYKE